MNDRRSVEFFVDLQLIASVTSSQFILHYVDSKLYGVSAHAIVFTFFCPLDLSQALSHSEMSSRQVSSSLSGSPPLCPSSHRPSSSHSPSVRRSAWPTRSSSKPMGSIPRTSARKNTVTYWTHRRCIMTTSSISPILKTLKR